ncbi:MAG: hypothetical protein KatS3mg029_0667 [Saprospiraceae bacterium]|nr:MAG: hypothetical protein KatS3mg029_0667 [Saprospiraceae bacterium]
MRSPHSKLFLLFLLLLLQACTHFFQSNYPQGPFENEEGKRPDGTYPAEEFWLAQAYPDGRFSAKAYEKALKQAHMHALSKNGGFGTPWRIEGPSNIGARVNTLAVNPNDEQIIYAGFSTGGVWKTTDGGQTWMPVFDKQNFLSIGDIAIDPSNPEVVYVGTGDPNITGYPFIGDGLWRSSDGGQSWQHLGLEQTRIISRVIIHPTNPHIIYVAAMGLPMERNADRGVYRSTDGGQTWSQVLFLSQQAGVTDLQMDPFDPSVLYAAGWDRIRNNQESIINGTNARIYKTSDGGDTWTMLTNGLPAGPQGRPALALSKQTPGVLYVRYVGTNSQLQGIYKSTDGGLNWTPFPISGLESALGGFGWYFGTFAVHPEEDDHLYLLGIELHEYLPAEGAWQQVGPSWWAYDLHADKHDLVFGPSGAMYLATDGGIYKSIDGGLNWTDIEQIPTTQFYRVGWNPHLPDKYYGGAQDNGTTGGNHHFISDWERIYGGDGFQPAFRPDLPNVMYAETQNGGIVVSADQGLNFQTADNGIDNDDRRNWDMPYIVSRHDPDVLYAGTFRLYRSTAGVVPLFEPISDDLTDGLVIHPRYHNITEISESPLQQGLLYVATADGNIWRTDDDGNTWVKISNELPDRFVSDVVASPNVLDAVYASHSGYKDNEFIPRLFRSMDRGATWESITGDLPEAAVNEILVLPGHADSVLFVATDAGVWGTIDAGQHWQRIGENLPFVPVYDLGWNPVERRLIAGTFARSILTWPVDSLLPPPDTISATITPARALHHAASEPEPRSHF